MCKLLGLLSLVCLVVAAVHAEEENPLKKAKVGDWVAYKTVNKMGGMEMTMEMKKTVIKKTDTEVTIEMVNKVMGQEMKNSYTVNLNEKYDPRVPQVKDKGEVTFKELDKGQESLTVGGKTIKTTWSSFEATSKAGAVTMNTKGKTWISPEVPVDGLVKSEMETVGAGKMNMELVDFGSGK